jgi:cytochrome P450
MLRPHFARDQIINLSIYERHVQHLIDALPRDHSTVDLQNLFFDLTMDIATEVFFGQSTNILNPKLSTLQHTAFAEAFNYSRRVIAGFSNLDLTGVLQKIFPNRTLHTQINIVNTYIDTFVQTALEDVVKRDEDKAMGIEKTHERQVFLHELVKETTDPVRIRSEVLNILVAGRDSTASLLSNTWFILAKRPDVWNKLRAEVDELHGNPPTYSQIKSMRYLSYVIKECKRSTIRLQSITTVLMCEIALRLLPPVPINHRTAEADTVLPHGGGSDGTWPVFIAKGTLVAYSLYAMHRRTDLYGTDAEEFRPERWENLKPGWEFLPFHGGPRACLGREYLPARHLRPPRIHPGHFFADHVC